MDQKLNLWIQGPPQVGKNHFVRTRFNRDEVYRKPLSKGWFCGYQDEAVVWIDEMDEVTHLSAAEIKTIADQYPFMAEPKREHWMIRPRHVIVTSNCKIEEMFDKPIHQEAIYARFQVVDLFERCIGTSHFCACIRCVAIEVARERVAAKLSAAVESWQMPVDEDGRFCPVRVVPPDVAVSSQPSQVSEASAASRAAQDEVLGAAMDED